MSVINTANKASVAITLLGVITVAGLVTCITLVSSPVAAVALAIAALVVVIPTVTAPIARSLSGTSITDYLDTFKKTLSLVALGVFIITLKMVVLVALGMI